LDLLKTEWKNYEFFNSIINKQQNTNKEHNNKINEKYLITKLDSMKSLIKEEISTNYLLLSKEVQNLPQDFLVISGIKDNEIASRKN